jgi:hypothetical protein
VKKILFIIIIFINILPANAQNLSGVWHGTITKGGGILSTKYKLELKLVAVGDSIKGTSYYYNSKNNYYRYSVKGYRNAHDNLVHWWDDVLLESKVPNVKMKAANTEPFSVAADFNCPGEGNMFLNGPATLLDNNESTYTFDGKKVNNALFNDEWNWVIDNYYNGAADKAVIDSVANIGANKQYNPYETPQPNKDVAVQKPMQEPETTNTNPQPKPQSTTIETPTSNNEPLVNNPFYKKEAPKPDITNIPAATKEVQMDSLRWYVTKDTVSTAPKTLQVPQLVNSVNIKKFESRTTQQVISIPIEGEKITLKFYDNATIDGDSIAVFLNKKLIKEHMYLTFDAQTIEIPVKELANENELVMVAENLGSIPPNTSTLIVYVNNNRYEVSMESNEQKSAAIRFYKKQ